MVIAPIEAGMLTASIQARRQIIVILILVGLTITPIKKTMDSIKTNTHIKVAGDIKK
jgi:hypothetical protein